MIGPQNGGLIFKRRMEMKRLWFFVAALAALSLAGAAFAAEVTQKYEVVCLKCMAHNASMGKDGGHGAGHAACAMSCSMKGSDLGLMDSKGNLYVPINADFQSARDVIKDKAGQTVELKGEVVKTKGINYLKLAGSTDSKDKDGDKD